MGFFPRAGALIFIVVRRLLAQFGMAAITLLGLVASVTLVICIPLYADAVYQRTMTEKVLQHGTGDEGLPFSFKFDFYGLWSGVNQWENVQPLDQYLSRSAATELGLPLQRVVRYFTTDLFELSAGPNGTASSGASAATSEGQGQFDLVKLGTMSQIEEHIQITEGGYPTAAEAKDDRADAPSADGTSVVEVLSSLSLANHYGLQIGETYTVVAISRSEGDEQSLTRIPIRIAGIWQARDPNNPYWSIEVPDLEITLLVPEETFVNRICPYYNRDISLASWQVVLDGSVISADEVSKLIEKINVFEKKASGFLPNFSMTRSPVQDLLDFQNAASRLRILLYAFALPIFGLLLAFLALVANLTVERKRNEIAVTRSRGATAWQVLGSIALESGLLGGMAFALSLPIAMLVTQWMGLTRSFMEFSSRTPLPLHWSRSAIQAGVGAVIVILLVTLWPAFSAVRHTIVSYKQERARLVRPPFWQRAWIDVLLMIPAAYGAYLLSRQGSILVEGSQDPLGNPLLFLVPSLVVLALTLFLLRLLPYALRGLAWLAGHTRWVGLLLSSRQLSRSHDYHAPLLILVLTLSLSIYTASLAQTLDQHLSDRMYYQTGADLRILRVGEGETSVPSMPGQTTVGNVEALSFPVSEYLKIKGITDVTRVGHYPAEVRLITGGTVKGMFYGIDRLEFSRLAFWRDDFALAPLPAMMNVLGAVPEGVLAPTSFLAEYNLREGESIELAVQTDLGRVVMQSRIVGSFDLFPTWYAEQDGPLMVGNLEMLFDQVGGQASYQVWARTNSDFDFEKVRGLQVSDLNLRVLSWLSAPPNIIEMQGRPEQQGIFGFLFIGFLAAALMTVVGFLLYAFFSYQRRYIELGVLRAGGLSRDQMTAYLAFELLFLILIGGATGTGLGAWISQQFIPSLQVGDKPTDRMPPFQVILAWPAIYQIYALFGILFVITLIVLVILLQRMKIFQAIKLGETV